jgi:hypothetical protein
MYEQTYKRLERLKKTFDGLVHRNEELEEALRVARINKETYDLRDAARDRILIELSEENQRLKRESLPPPEEIWDNDR